MYDPTCQRLTGIHVAGPVIATALVAAAGNGAAFMRNAIRGVGARTGKPRLLGISKRGELISSPALRPANKLARIARAVLVRQEPYCGIAQATI